MSNEFDTEPDEAELEALTRLLGSDAVWAEPSPDVEDRVLAAIAESAAASGVPEGLGALPSQAAPASEPEPVTDLGKRRAERNDRRQLWPLAAAAAVLLAVISAGTVFGLNRSQSSDVLVVAMAPTELAPDASATARVDELPNGVQLIIDISGLEAAPPGFFYEVWLVRAEPRTSVSAGTFHMRGSDNGEIEFWAGVSTEVYNVITITLESEADPGAQGELVLKGQIAP